MIQISALNDSSSDESDADIPYESTKEAQESDGFALYNKALGLQRTGCHQEAERVYHQLLNTRLLKLAEPPEDPDKPGGLIQPGLMLKYSTYKNLGSIAFQRNDLSAAIEHYVEASTLDSTDVTLWYKIGSVAVELISLPLARVAFQQGLACNQKHWPCLDQLCTVLYALNDYASCLYYICKALERDATYIKGLALRDQIFTEQPSFRKDSYHMFRHCADSIHNARVDKQKANKIIKEALDLRDKKRALQKKPPSPVLTFLKPFRKYAWKDLGEQLIALYDHINDRIPALNIGCTIDVTVRTQEISKEGETETPMNINKNTTTSLSTSDAKPVASESNIPQVESNLVKISPSSYNDAANLLEETHDQRGLSEGVVADGGQEVEAVKAGTGQSEHDTQRDPEDMVAGEVEKSTEMLSAMECDDISSCTTTITTTTTTPTTQGVIDHQHPTGTVSPPVVKEKKRRGPKRKREKIDFQELYGGKRRSARVRNTTKKKEETVSVNYAELLQRFLPSSLNDSEVEDEGSQDGATDSQDETLTQTATPMEQSVDKACENDPSFFISSEEEEVKQFLQEYQDNSGVLDLMHFYLVSLAQKYKMKWPSKLTDVYVKVFERLRNHCCFPDVLSSDASQSYRRGVGDMLLVYAEFKLDQWLIERGKAPSHHNTPKKSSLSDLTLMTANGPPSLPDFPGQFFEEDLGYIEDMSHLPPIAGESWRTYAIRVNWMKSRFLQLQGQSEASVHFFDECTYLLTSGQAADKLTVKLPNCIQDNIINTDQIEEQKKSLENCQSLEEVQRLYSEDKHQRVIELLLPTVLQPNMVASGHGSMMMMKMQAPSSVNKAPERQEQLRLLHQALIEMKDYRQCVICGTASLAETWQGFVSAQGREAREEWTALLIQILEALDMSLSKGLSVLVSVERRRLVQLTSVLIVIIEYAMEGAETDSLQPLTTVLPWIVLYKLIKLQEDKLTAMRISSGSPARSSSPIPMMPSSLMLLETAHEYLGRHSWCCNSEGALLKLYVNVIKSEMSEYVDEEEAHPFQDDLQLALEQCFYCLYAHPNRRSKARHLQHHEVEEVPLKWEAADFLFDSFKPKVVPEFDSYKANSMSADLESLFLKISKIIPAEENPTNTLESVQSYMEGNCDKPPAQDKEDTRPVVKEIHYFLADFYFKNKEFGKAIKFYSMDICVCPNRLDSWAGVALSRSGRLDLKLNSCDSKTETPIYKNSSAALVCFQRALEIDSTNLALWIEFGSLAYTLHSHASRQLKQRVHLRLSDDTLELLREKQKDMLQRSGDCFLKASQCEGDGDGEEWLVEYMLGKVAEKQHTDPRIYLGHYLQAAHHLYENEAKYPKRITYHNPPDLSLEALEMFFRLHASILKLLEKTQSDDQINYNLLNEFVQKASDTPFVRAKEKKNSENSDMSSNESEGKSSYGQRSRLSSSGTPMSPAYMMNPQDHDYSKKKKRKIILETSTETASEGEMILSGDDTTNSSFSPSASSAQLLKSLAAEMKHKEGSTTTVTDTSEGITTTTETESSQDESMEQVKLTVGSTKATSIGSAVPASSKGSPVVPVAIVPVAITKVGQEDNIISSGGNLTSDDQEMRSDSDSEIEIINLSDSSDSPAPQKRQVLPPAKKKVALKQKVVKKTAVPPPSSESKLDCSFIDLTVDSSDSDGVVGTPPRRALHESPIKVSAATKAPPKALGTGSTTSTVQMTKGQEVKELSTDEPMQVEGGKDNKTPEKKPDKKTPPPSDTKPSAIDERTSLIKRCLDALGLCLSRFPQHYKSLYRLSHAYSTLDSLKNLQYSRDLLLGTQSAWQLADHMPSPALFGEHVKTKNLFQGIWRIPITEIDRSGSFPWHMYRSVVLLLEVLEHLQDHPTLLQVAIKLAKIPEQGKKYLRDMDRQYLSQQSYQLCLAVLQHQISEASTSKDDENKINALLAANRVYNAVQTGKLHQADAAVPGNILKDAYKSYKGSQVESEPSVIEQAIRFCNYYQIANKIPQTPTSQHGDMSFLGRSPKDTFYGSPIKGSQSDTRIITHDRTSPEFPISRTVIGGQSGVSQDTALNNQPGSSKTSTAPSPSFGSSMYSSRGTDFEEAFKESLIQKTIKLAKKVNSAPSKMTSQGHTAKSSTQPKVITLSKAPSVTSKPIQKLRTLSSQKKLLQQQSQPKQSDYSSSMLVKSKTPITSSVPTTSGIQLSPAKRHISLLPSSQSPTQSAPVSVDVVQRLREALDSRQPDASDSTSAKRAYVNKLSLNKGGLRGTQGGIRSEPSSHKKDLATKSGSAGSHGNKLSTSQAVVHKSGGTVSMTNITAEVMSSVSSHRSSSQQTTTGIVVGRHGNRPVSMVSKTAIGSKVTGSHNITSSGLSSSQQKDDSAWGSGTITKSRPLVVLCKDPTLSGRTATGTFSQTKPMTTVLKSDSHKYQMQGAKGSGSAATIKHSSPPSLNRQSLVQKLISTTASSSSSRYDLPSYREAKSYDHSTSVPYASKSHPHTATISPSSKAHPHSATISSSKSHPHSATISSSKSHLPSHSATISSSPKSHPLSATISQSSKLHPQSTIISGSKGHTQRPTLSSSSQGAHSTRPLGPSTAMSSQSQQASHQMEAPSKSGDPKKGTNFMTSFMNFLGGTKK